MVDRFLALDDAETASTLRNAILRAPGNQGPDIAMLEAKIDIANGDSARAEVRIDNLLEDQMCIRDRPNTSPSRRILQTSTQVGDFCQSHRQLA